MYSLGPLNLRIGVLQSWKFSFFINFVISFSVFSLFFLESLLCWMLDHIIWFSIFSPPVVLLSSVLTCFPILSLLKDFLNVLFQLSAGYFCFQFGKFQEPFLLFKQHILVLCMQCFFHLLQTFCFLSFHLFLALFLFIPTFFFPSNDPWCLF